MKDLLKLALATLIAPMVTLADVHVPKSDAERAEQEAVRHEKEVNAEKRRHEEGK